MTLPDIPSIINFRKKLHANPELSGEEKETSKMVKERIQKLNPDEIFEVAETGLIVTFNGGEDGPTVLVRSELDALPIHEINDFEHRSKVEDVGHKCGHDGHTSILIGLAEAISENRPQKGKLALLFQPAEENGKGAVAVLADPKFEKIKPDYVFAMHNLPGFPSKTLILKNGAFTSAVCTLIIKLTGKTAHAAEPENGKNPIYAIAEILRKSQELEDLDQTSKNFNIITPVYSRVGGLSYGVAPGDGEIHLTVRAWETRQLEKVTQELTDWANVYGLSNGFKLDISRAEEFAANVNDTYAVDLLEEVAKENGIPVRQTSLPFRWGEDFGLFTEKYRGAMFGIGSGENWPALHNPDYDFPDEIIEPGVKIFYSVVKRILG